MVLNGSPGKPEEKMTSLGPTGPIASKLPTLLEKDKKVAIDESRKAFYNRRRIQIGGIPRDSSTKELSQTLLKNFDVVYILVNEKGFAHVLLKNTEEAEKAMSFVKGKLFRGNMVAASFSQGEFLVFVGNIPYSYSALQFKNIVKPFGEVERVILMRSELTGQSKGYGFVEFTYKAAVEKALKELGTVHKGLRVNLANPGLNEYYDLQSQTLYVNQFPASTKSEQIEELFDKHVQVPFCKIPLNDSTGKPCDFALVDCKSPEDAEKLWKELDGNSINGGTMRVSFSSPGRLAATSFGGPQFQATRTVVESTVTNNLTSSTETRLNNNKDIAAPPKKPEQPRNKISTATKQLPQSSRPAALLPSPPGPRPPGPIDFRRNPGTPTRPAPNRPIRNMGFEQNIGFGANVGGRGQRMPGPGGPPRAVGPQGGPPRTVGPSGGPPRPVGPLGGPPRGVGPRGPPNVPVQRGGFGQSNPRGPPAPLDGRPPRPGNLRGDLRSERPRFSGDFASGPRGPRPRSQFPTQDRPLLHTDPQSRGRQPEGPLPRPPRPRGPSIPDQNRPNFPPEDRFPSKGPHSRPLPDEPLRREPPFHPRGAPVRENIRFDSDRRNPPSRDIKDDRQVPGQRNRSWHEPEEMEERRTWRDVPDNRRPIWDKGQERADTERNSWSRDRAELHNEFEEPGGFDGHRGSQPHFQDQRGRPAREPPNEQREDPKRRPPFDRRRDFDARSERGRESRFGSDGHRGPPPGHEEPWTRERSPHRGYPREHTQNEPREEPRPPFQQRAPWKEPPPRKDYNEPPTDERWPRERQGIPPAGHLDERGRNFHDELRGHEREQFPRDMVQRDDADRFRRNDIREPFQPRFDERQRLPPDQHPQQQHPPEQQFPRERLPPANYGPNQGPPAQGHFGSGPPPHDRQPLPLPSQVGDVQEMPRNDFMSGHGVPPPRFEAPTAFQDQRSRGMSQPQDQRFPQPPWQQQQPVAQQERFAPPLGEPKFPGHGPNTMPPQMQGPLSSSSAPTQLFPQQAPGQPVSSAPTLMQPVQAPPAPQQQGIYFPAQNQPTASFIPSSAPVMTTTTTSVAMSMPTVPAMTALQMPSIPGANVLPAAGAVQLQQGAASQPGVPSLQQAPGSAATQPVASQLDTYVAAASAAQQYAQYYEQLAKQQEAISQQPSAPGSKDAANLAAQAKAYAQYYQQYYQHMQSILQMAKTQQATRTAQQQPGSVTAPVVQPQPSPATQPHQPSQSQINQQIPPQLSAQQAATQQQYPSASQFQQGGTMPGMLAKFQPQNVPPPPWQAQQAAPQQTHAGAAVSQHGLAPVQQQPGGNLQQPPGAIPQQLQGQYQMQPSSIQPAMPVASGFQQPNNMQQPWPVQHKEMPPQRPADNQLLSSRHVGLGGVAPLPTVGQQQQQQRVESQFPGQRTQQMQQFQQPLQQQQQQHSLQQQHSVGSYAFQQQPLHSKNAPQQGGAQVVGHIGGPQQQQQQQQPGPASQSSLAPSGMNWMYPVTQAANSERPQHFAKPVLYTSSSAPRDPAGGKRQDDPKPVLASHKRPRY
ncbi:protein piccolo-like isoform X2 [Rhopilema esculentum]|uniref:protein piccolo-like isoform X2 n=1 Tax=Rhopilema esculentum TaxID=499914 RepID=UPI0031D290CE